MFESVGILSLANRLGLGAGICIHNILDTKWGQNFLLNGDKTLLPNGGKPLYVFHICSAENVFRKNHRNIKKKIYALNT
jgi:hypothetical protein